MPPLRRRAERDVSKIHVETADGTVTPKGTARNWTGRADAESAAWSPPGVVKVDDTPSIA